MIENWGTDRRIQGASTITQQVARTIFLSNKYTFSRKAHEAILALALERKFSKDQILELYMNKVYYGGGAYGIDAASRKFFGHSAKQLRSEEHTSELQSLMRNSYAVFCLKKKNIQDN